MFVMKIRGGPTRWSPTPNYVDAVRIEPRVGDRYIYMVVDGDSTYTNTNEVVAVDGDVVTVSYSGADGFYTYDTTVDGFMAGFYPLPSLVGAEAVGSETLTTFAGEVECTVYDVTENGDHMRMWVSDASGVMYRMEATGPHVSETYVLTENTMMAASADAPAGVRTEPGVGDYIVTSLSASIGGQEIGYDTADVILAVDGGSIQDMFVTVAGNSVASVPASQFIGHLVPDLSGYEFRMRQIVPTPYGDLLCDMYVGETYESTTTVWVGSDTGISYRTAILLDGGTVFTSLKDTSLFGEAPGVVDLGMAVPDGLSVGDYYEYRCDAYADGVLYDAWGEYTRVSGIDGDTVTYSFDRYNDEGSTGGFTDGTAEDFLAGILVPSEAAGPVRSEVVDTCYGERLCDVFIMEERGTRTEIWADSECGLVFRYEVAVDGNLLVCELDGISFLEVTVRTPDLTLTG